jgi:23S rRNA G2445 N2-methylase RlmL
MEYFAVCPRGVEDLCAEEIRQVRLLCEGRAWLHGSSPLADPQPDVRTLSALLYP